MLYLTQAYKLLKFLRNFTDELTNSSVSIKVEKQPFNFELFNDYAISHRLTNPSTLTFEYSEIYKNSSSDSHKEFADVHYENSKLFVRKPDRHRHSVAASRVVHAYLTKTVTRITNIEFVKRQRNL